MIGSRSGRTTSHDKIHIGSFEKLAYFNSKLGNLAHHCRVRFSRSPYSTRYIRMCISANPPSAERVGSIYIAIISTGGPQNAMF